MQFLFLSFDAELFVAMLYAEPKLREHFLVGKSRDVSLFGKGFNSILGEVVVPIGSRERISPIDHKPCKHFNVTKLRIAITTTMLVIPVDSQEPPSTVA